MADDFDWQDDDVVACREQEALAVYPNPKGEIVIRRQARWDEDEDPFFLLQAENALAFAQAILDASGAAAWITTDRMARMMAARPDIDWVAVMRDLGESESANLPKVPKDKTGAARQRRYRERHRNAVTRDDRDTDRDSVTAERDAPLLIAAE